MSKTSLKTTVEWNSINWRKLERRVYKLQKRIYKASQRGDVKAVRRLQKTLMKSWSAKCLTVWKVTQDNQGKKTAGVDGVKSLSPAARLRLVKNLKLGTKAKPTRRVWILKPGTQEKCSLSIPTMKDRALQVLIKMALEPEWEARFEPNSYGFRPGRSCHDAIQAIYDAIRYKAKYVLDADIATCFDCIDHNSLLRKLNTSPTIRRQVRAWLKSGVIDWNAYANRQKTYSHIQEGTLQGGITPLLANIALHGMENRLRQAFPEIKIYQGSQYVGLRNPAILVRYADDFVVLHEDLGVVQKCQQIITKWLKDMGLELKPSETRLVHTLNPYGEEKPGFDFLGFTIRHYVCGQYKSGKYNGKTIGFKSIITPSDETLKQHTNKISKTIQTHTAATQRELISNLNPIIQEWVTYYSSVASSKVYSKADKLTYQQLRTWAKRRHPSKTAKWTAQKYWQTIGQDRWRFATKDKQWNLTKHSETKIERYVKVQGERSPYDGDWMYWSSRMGSTLKQLNELDEEWLDASPF